MIQNTLHYYLKLNRKRKKKICIFMKNKLIKLKLHNKKNNI